MSWPLRGALLSSSIFYTVFVLVSMLNALESTFVVLSGMTIDKDPLYSVISFYGILLAGVGSSFAKGKLS